MRRILPRAQGQKSGWLGKPAAQMRADAEANRDAQPVVERCLFCRWHYKGTAGEGREKARQHRAKHHPGAVGRKTYRKPRSFQIGPVDETVIEENRKARLLREEAEKLASIERGRQRREAAA